MADLSRLCAKLMDLKHRLQPIPLTGHVGPTKACLADSGVSCSEPRSVVDYGVDIGI